MKETTEQKIEKYESLEKYARSEGFRKLADLYKWYANFLKTDTSDIDFTTWSENR